MVSPSSLIPRLRIARSMFASLLAMLALGLAGSVFCAAQSAPPPAAVVVPVAPVSVTETQWNLVEIDGEPIPAGSGRPYIYLQEPGDKLSGSGGCNRLFGSFDLSPGSLQFHSVASTKMACADDSQRHEPELLQALNLTTSYRVSGDVLELRADERVLARFQARKK